VDLPSNPDKQNASMDVARSVTGFLTTTLKKEGILELVAWTIGGV